MPKKQGGWLHETEKRQESHSNLGFFRHFYVKISQGSFLLLIYLPSEPQIPEVIFQQQRGKYLSQNEKNRNIVLWKFN